MKNHYHNIEITSQYGGKTIRKVTIKNGKGYKSITKYYKGKRISSIKKPIHKDHIELIISRKFIPGLFDDCKKCTKSYYSKTRKHKHR